MPLFGRQKAPQLTEEERQAAEVDLERIRQGGIPLGAEQRLKRVAAASTPFFTSDLSAKEYALAQASGLVPIAQVMGSSVVQHGWQYYPWSSYWGGIREAPQFANQWNLSRQRAFDRLRQEAALAGADGVIGIEIESNAFLGERAVIELIVFGTAVRESTLATHGRAEPRMCALSGQDVDKLRRIGAATLGVIGHTACVIVSLGSDSNWIMNASAFWGAGRQNIEIKEIGAAVSQARHLAMREVERQASALGANDMVISVLKHDIHHHEYEQNSIKYHQFLVSMHVLGTAIALGAHEPHPAPLGTPALAMNLSR